jgi:hypothetical protein
MGVDRLETPVALIIFNRPEATARVFAEIARQQPRTLLVVGDAARDGRAGEGGRVAAARAIVTDGVNWECDVVTNFAERNLGCRVRVSSGIDWIFQQVERAIILEDDCVPHASFFRFCEELLERYAGDQRVSQINGVNFQGGFRLNDDSYYFSRYSHVWGWASWRDRWQGMYDVNLGLWPRIRDEGRLVDLVGGSREAGFWAPIFEGVYRGEIDTWDFQWAFACMIAGAVSALPNQNLISNIGFGADATHTVVADSLSELPRHEMIFPLKHPIGTFPSRTLDKRLFESHYHPSVYSRMLRKVSRTLRLGAK